MNPLLLLHGAIGSSAQLKPIAAALTDREVHALDFSGHGGKPINGVFSIERFAADVLDFLDANHVAQADFFGYSMGGYVALFLAHTHPRRVGRILTLATKFEWSPEIAAKEIKMLDPEKITEKIPAFAAELEKRHTPNDWKQVLSQTAELMTGLGHENRLPAHDLASIAQTVRLMIGDRDTMVTLEETISVYRLLPNASLAVLPMTPHPIEKIAIDRLVQEIKSFIQ